MRNYLRTIFALLAVLVCIACFAQENLRGQISRSPKDLRGRTGLLPEVLQTDTSAVLDEVVVSERLSTRHIIDGQKLNGEQIERLSNNSIADALRYFSGLQVKDYGGVGGLKTVNIRSMGTNHLGVFYDGIELGNAQNGVIDLGQFSLDNIDEISLCNGQKSQIFQPAADFGNAGSVYIRTRRPRFFDGKGTNLRLRLKYGSSDMLRFSGVWDEKLSESLFSSVSLGVLSSSGKYKFRYQRQNIDGSLAYDTTATRQNGDVLALRAEANLHGVIPQGGWNLKLYSYQSGRGIPGAIVNNVWRRGERQSDSNNFLQGTWQKSMSDRYDTQLRAKYAYYHTHYINKDTTVMRVDNIYRQQEFYISSANAYEILPWWSASLNYDLRWNMLRSDIVGFANPDRLTHMAAAASAFEFGRLQIQGSLLGTFSTDRTSSGSGRTSSGGRTGRNTSAYTPALFVSFKPSRWLILDAYAKQNYRLPTFNDLYYTEIGNAELKPERATQYDISLTLLSNGKRKAGNVSPFASQLKVSAYYNTVHDKIVAYPKGQQFRWTMLNLGRVHIKGMDIEGEVSTALPNTFTAKPSPVILTARLQYTYQEATDVTNPANSFYRHQIPYIPWHSGSAILNAEWRNISVNYSFIYSGKRYCQQENIQRNEMLPWYTSDLSVSYKTRSWRFTLDINNLLSQDYDVIINYPMPKRNYAITASYEV